MYGKTLADRIWRRQYRKMMCKTIRKWAEAGLVSKSLADSFCGMEPKTAKEEYAQQRWFSRIYDRASGIRNRAN